MRINKTQPKAFSTSWLLRSSRSARRPRFARGAHKIRTKFTTSVFSRNFARFKIRTPSSQNVGAKYSADSAESCADVMRVAQRTRPMPAEFCERAPKSNKICVGIARFLAQISTIPNAAHVEVGRRASRALRNTHDIGVAFSRVSAAFGANIF